MQTVAVGIAVWGTSSETAFLDLTRPLDPDKVLPTVLSIGRTAERDSTARIDARRAVAKLPRYPRRGARALTNERVLQIRAAAKLGEPQRIVADRFGVGQSTVSRILNGGDDQ